MTPKALSSECKHEPDTGTIIGGSLPRFLCKHCTEIYVDNSIIPITSICNRIGCGKDTIGTWYCKEHSLYKDFRYGLYDLKTNNKGFRLWAIKRIYSYLKYKLTKENK